MARTLFCGQGQWPMSHSTAAGINLLPITALIYHSMHVPLHLQENPPYNKGAFKIEITFPAEYPFKPPKICFKTRIYHPNIDEKGQVCLPIISAENWKPATKTDQGRNKVNDLCLISTP